ncbi:substrate-binding periplasmic protein [Roseateles sp. DB2]|uniref:substrate-binding periplasmic protein n=1 Tax=Roseateles sp. DB2 TaxID=3453717 RepID=UPI003EEADC4D
MTTRRLAVLALTCCSPSLALAGEPPLRISTLLEQDPATQVAERVLREAYRQLGRELQVLSMPGERSLLSANTGETDGELYRRAGIDTLYPNLLRVPVELLQYEIVVFSRRWNFKVQGWDSLRPYRLGFVKGIKIIEENTKGMQLEPVATLQQAFVKMELDRSDLVLSNRLSGLASLRQHGVQGVVQLQPPLATFPVFHYLHRRHEALLAPLTQALRELERSGFIRRTGEEVALQYRDTPAPQKE